MEVQDSCMALLGAGGVENTLLIVSSRQFTYLAFQCTDWIIPPVYGGRYFFRLPTRLSEFEFNYK